MTEKAVLEVFTPVGGGARKGGSYKKNIAAVLKAAAATYPALAVIAGFLPELRDARRNIQYLDSDEIEKVKDALRGGALTLRDKAVGTLALHTGLRSCDIAAMTVASIDWDADLIRVGQQKTGSSA